VADLQIQPELLTVEQSAALCSISRSDFYGKLSAGIIGPEPIRLGRSIRFSRRALMEWIAAGCPPRSQWQVRKNRTQTNMRLNAITAKAG
jgi:excisionase family DNA binding protein